MMSGCSAAPPAKPQALNVLLITIDTLRADRIGTGLTPTLDRLATSGVRFTTARTAVPLTLPSHATIHTGLLPPEHGVRQNGIDPLDATHPTVAVLLKRAGYDTAAFVGAFVLDHRFGLSQGFDTYDDHIPRDPDATDRLEAERPAAVVIDHAVSWLERRSAAAPFFLWLHLYDPHAPYEPPKEFLTRGRTPYDGEVAYADSQVARVLDWLRGRGLSERTLVVVAGDHGEGLGEHGERTHGMLVYDSTLRVPLIIGAPGRPAAVRDEPVSLTDLAPTILHAAGVSPAPAMHGRDLLDQAVARQPHPNLYSESEYPRVVGWSPVQALTDGRWLTIRAGPSIEVYDLEHDWRQEHDISSVQPSIAAAMAARASAIHGQASSRSRPLTAEAQERLRSLGYVAGSSPTAPASDAPNPASRIGTWNEVEDALRALAAHHPDALAKLRRLASANPDAPVLQTTYASALKAAGDTAAALGAYRHAAKRWPTDAVLLHDLAVAARDAAEAARGADAAALHDEAVRADQAALTLDPDSAAALNGLGLLAVDRGNTEEAVKAFARAAALDSNNASYWINLGNARRGAGDRSGAEEAYRRALAADPRTADAANGLGVLLVEANRPADAAPWFERAVAAAPDLVEARLNLGIALQGAGKTTEAADEYRRVLSARGAHPREKAAARTLLAAMGRRR